MPGAHPVQFDRMAGTHFSNAAEGGDALLWQHVSWCFGHPAVYFIFVPALGFISAIIPTFVRRPMFGYGPIACRGSARWSTTAAWPCSSSTDRGT
jgi:heme/copper-type cytochrome/quinol oxidase subunit 1